MQLTFTEVGVPSDGVTQRNAITPQETEIYRLRNECNVAKAELQSLKSELDERRSLCNVTRELRDLLRDERDHGLRKQLSAMENINGMLRTQLQEEQRRVSAAELCNGLLQSEILSSNGTRLELEETLLRNERISTRLKEAEDNIRFLESRLDEMEERARVAEREQEWTEQQLVYSSQYVKDILVEISSLRAIQQGLEKDVPSAFCRGLRLNTDLLDRAQGELVQAKAREVTLLLEIVDLKDKLKHEPKSEVTETTSVSSHDSLEIGVSACSRTPGNSTGLHSPTSIIEDDPRSHMTPGGILEDMFRALSSKTPDPIAIKEVLGIRNMAIVFPADFVWVSCPDTAYFVKPALYHGKGGKLQDSKLKSIRRLQKQGAVGVELIPYFSGAYYYVGTYTVGDAEPMSAGQFEQLPQKAQEGVVTSSGRPTERALLRELYLSGKLSAIRFSVRRIGFNSRLHQYLRANA